MKKTWTLLASFVILSAPIAANANIWIPSFVQCITSPLLASLSIIALIVTIPVTLAVSALEAFVVRRCTKGVRLTNLLRNLIVINVITSIFGAMMMPMGTELWPGLLICFLSTVISEGVLLFVLAAGMQFPRSLRQAMIVSAKMNTISYAVLAVILLGVIYLPRIGNESRVVRSAVSGKLVAVNFSDNFQVMNFSSNPPSLTRQELDLDSVDSYVCGNNGRICGLMPHKTIEIKYTNPGWSKRYVSLPSQVSDTVGISPDGRLVCCTVAERPVIYDVISKRVVRDLKKHIKEADFAAFSYDGRWVAVGSSYDVHLQGAKISKSEWKLVNLNTGAGVTLAEAWGAVFSPTSDLLAWELDNTILIRDCGTGTAKSWRVPGSISSRIAWSPDGKFIAYLGHPNHFTAQNWRPDVRAVDVKTGESATLYADVFTSGAPCYLFWLK